MGLFSNNKKPCPVCGKPTPRLLATKIADQTPICSDCSNQISMSEALVEKLSKESLIEHHAMREENARYLETTFIANKVIPIGFTELNIDQKNKLFTIPLIMCGDTENPPVFKFEELNAYEILADSKVIERFARGDTSPTITPIVFKSIFNVFDKENKPQDDTCSFLLVLYLSNPCWDRIESNAGSVSASRGMYKAKISYHLEQLKFVTRALQEIIEMERE